MIFCRISGEKNNKATQINRVRDRREDLPQKFSWCLLFIGKKALFFTQNTRIKRRTKRKGLSMRSSPVRSALEAPILTRLQPRRLWETQPQLRGLNPEVLSTSGPPSRGSPPPPTSRLYPRISGLGSSPEGSSGTHKTIKIF